MISRMISILNYWIKNDSYVYTILNTENITFRTLFERPKEKDKGSITLLSGIERSNNVFSKTGVVND